jgi:hypothetical protein
VALAIALIAVVLYYNNLVNQNILYMDRLIDEKAELQKQVGQLQSLYNSARVSKLIGTLNAVDSRPIFQTSRLRVYGNVVNVGSDPANNAVFYVEGFQGAVLAFNTTINLGTISGESFAVYVDENVFYSGSPLTQWRIWSNPAGIDWTWQA